MDKRSSVAAALGIHGPARIAAAFRVWDAARCAQVDPDLFFPEEGQPAAPARAVCADCPVRAECLAVFGPLVAHGVLGGLTDRERRDRRQTAAAEPEVAA